MYRHRTIPSNLFLASDGEAVAIPFSVGHASGVTSQTKQTIFMINPVPTACTLTCDNCNTEFNAHTRHVFKTPQQASLLAERAGWWVNHLHYKAFCPQCAVINTHDYSVDDLRNALQQIRQHYHPRVGDGNNKAAILQLLGYCLNEGPIDNEVVWRLCINNKLVWYDEYSNFYKIIA